MGYLHLLQPKSKKITNLFKNANIGIAFKNNNTVQKLLNQRESSSTHKLKKGIYTNLHVTHAKWHTSDKPTAISDKDTRSI